VRSALLEIVRGSLAAIEASSMASAMRANRGYWRITPVALTVTITGATFASTDATLSNVYGCKSGGANAPCTPQQIAAYDLQAWIAATSTLLPALTGTLTCVQPAATQPIGCTIQLSWSERNIQNRAAVSTGTAVTANAAMAAPTYTLYVEP